MHDVVTVLAEMDLETSHAIISVNNQNIKLGYVFVNVVFFPRFQLFSVAEELL